jgi:NAD(P)-dependent dehydrogenase (short-subunit alcohol dehydrogenase family)
VIDSALKKFGSVNALVNSAAATSRGTLLDTTPETWDEHFNTNVRGPFLLMQRFVAHLVETGKPGSIVNILSMFAHCGQSFLTPYSASKGALATLTKNVANAFSTKRIRCNGLMLGWMDTPGETPIQQKFHGVRRSAFGVRRLAVGVTRRRRAVLPDGTYETHGTNVTAP